MSEESLAPTDSLAPLDHEAKAWDQHELLGSILAEYFQLTEKSLGRWPTWEVHEHKEGALHDDLVDANAHLERLGWMATLSPGKSWTVTVFPRPERQFPRGINHLWFWGLSFLTLTLAGDVWMRPSRPESGWFDSSSMLDAIIGYSLPILCTLLLATMIQRWMARKYGVRSGHILPVPDLTIAFYALGIFPSSWLFWPFGILLIPTMPRMDARPWPNRTSLGYVALSVPIVLMTVGTALLFGGLALTPQYLESISMPLITMAPGLLGFLATEFVHDDALIRMAWAHPWVHAGGMLLLFAWISLLPIPTFPGGRLLIARMGLREARSSGTQMLLLVTVLTFAYIFGVFDGLSLWYLVLALILPLLFFFGNDMRLPTILDESQPLEEQDHRRMGMLLFVAFLLFLPSQQPVMNDNDWDADLSFEIDSIDYATQLENGSWVSHNEIKIINPSSLKLPYAIDVVFEQQNHHWEIEWDCDGEDTRTLDGEGCGDELLPGRVATFWVNFSWYASPAPLASNVTFIIEMNDRYELHSDIVRPGLEVIAGDHWYDIDGGDHVLRCVDLEGTLIENEQLNASVGDSSIPGLQTSLVQINGVSALETTYDEVPNRFCLRGLDPLVFQPSMHQLQLNNASFEPLEPPRRVLSAVVPSTGWHITADEWNGWGAHLDSGGVLQVESEDGCKINGEISTPSRPIEGEWIWDTALRSSGSMPLIEEGQNLTVLMTEGINMSVCNDAFNPYPRLSWGVEQGPELMIQWMNTTSRFWTSTWAVAFNGTLLESSMGELTIHNPSNESIPFRIARQGGIGSDWTHDWNGEPLAPGDTSLSLQPPTTPYSTMWMSLESGTVVLHLASYE
ncbi:MAG: hypothetical protein L7S56_00965 [Candidatus Poseidonia sp.]|nr:hypothetical protein [Poseidonia sp.]